MSKLKRLPFALQQDERGTVLIPFALMSVIAIGAVGSAVDFGRAFQFRSKMQNSLDAAVISGMSVYQQTGDWTLAMNHANSNFNTYFAGSATQPTATITNNGTALSGVATATITAPFVQAMRSMMGPVASAVPSDFTVAASTSAELSGTTTTTTTRQKVEVAMMIDLTGSMGQSVGSTGTKIASLRSAGLDLVDILLPNSGVNDAAVKIAVAPFADYVNAGPYAAAVTNLPATGGSYSNISNLASTRQGIFSGTYSGLTQNTAGSQSGATPATANTGTGSGSTTVSGSVTSGGGTYTNQYCSSPTQTVTTVTTVSTYNNITAAVGTPYNSYNAYNSASYNSSHGISWGAYYWQSNSIWYFISDVGTSNGQGYGRLYRRNTNGSWSQYDNNYYINAYTPTTTTQTTTVAGCESQVAAVSSSKLISCVTERTTTSSGALDYTDSAPTSASDIGAYNHGVSSISNYSGDGKCHVAGRELAPVIPLTNAKSTVVDFFNGPAGNGPQIGGGTPGHLGTAWSWYLLSPNWSSIWPSSSAPASYTDTGTKKFAILMTDGEYNEQYVNTASATQALALCTAMKNQGITVITVGFGFSENAVTQATASATGTVGQRAMYTLQQCASPASGGTNNYYFPYDGNALRTTFNNIGAAVAAQTTTQVTAHAGRLTK